MATGKIKTLFSDKEKTEALFPRTKVSAVSDNNGVGLDALLNNINAEIDTKATEAFVTNKIAEAQLNGDGTEIDLSGYATKDDVRNIDFPVDSVNGKTGAVTLSASDVDAVPTTRKVNGKDLSGDIALNYDDVGAVYRGIPGPNTSGFNNYGLILSRAGNTYGTSGGVDNYYLFIDCDNNVKAGLQLNGASTINWNKIFTEKTPPTAAQVGAAPSGLNEEAIQSVTSTEQLDSALATAYNSMADNTVKFKTIGVNASGLPLGGGAWQFVINRAGANYGIIYGVCYNQGVGFVFRVLHNGSWGDWQKFLPSNFAPSGYGLGTKTPPTISGTTELDACRTTGSYRYVASGSKICGISFNYAGLSVYTMYGDECVQELRPLTTNWILRRNWYNGSWSAWELIGVARKKLWENASLSSAFNAQTISLDLSGYDGVEILYYVDSTTNIYQSTGFIKKGLPSVMYYVTASTGNRVHRTFTVNASGVVFDTATASSGIAASGLCKPYQIFGIKGVSA